MRPRDSQQSGQRYRQGRRPNRGGQQRQSTPPPEKTFWQKVVAFFSTEQTAKTTSNNGHVEQPARTSRKPESVAVTSPKLYVGNLSFDATESDLFDLFNGVGEVKNAEIVSHKYTQKSKGFAFVTMQSMDEAQRAVTELHDKDFMGRKLVVSGAKASENHSNRDMNMNDR